MSKWVSCSSDCCTLLACPAALMGGLLLLPPPPDGPSQPECCWLRAFLLETTDVLESVKMQDYVRNMFHSPRLEFFLGGPGPPASLPPEVVWGPTGYGPYDPRSQTRPNHGRFRCTHEHWAAVAG